MTQEKIARINALAKKSRTAEGLTEAEKMEQAQLRAEYLADAKANFARQLAGLELEYPDGTVKKLQPKS